MVSRLALRVFGLLFCLSCCVVVGAQKKDDWYFTQPGQVPAKDAKIVAGPTARKAPGGGYSISFRVNKPTDVAVHIVDAKGTTIRHLASGVLGKSAPAPFKAGKLAQTVKWDGKDDDGKPVNAKGLSARVDVCVRAKFDRFLGFKPGTMKKQVVGLDVDQQGNVYVLNDGPIAGHPSHFLYAYDRDGKYVRTVIPYNSNVPFKRIRDSIKQLATYKLKPFVKIPTGQIVPIACSPFSLNEKWPGMLGYVSDMPGGHRDGSPFARFPDGRFLFRPFLIGGKGNWQTLEKDGLYPVPMRKINPPTKKKLAWNAWHKFRFFIDSDNMVYMVGTSTRGMSGLDNAVFKYDGKTLEQVAGFSFAGKDKLPQPQSHIGEPGVSGDDEKHLNDPIAVAVDRARNILVAQRMGKIRQFRKDGMYLGEFAAPFEQIGNISCGKYPATEDALYVLGLKKAGRNRWSTHLAKVKPSSGDVVWQVTLPRTLRSAALMSMAVDTSKKPAIVWIGGGKDRRTLTRIEDMGDGVGKIKHLYTEGNSVAQQPYHIRVDLDSDVLFFCEANRNVVGRMKASDGTDRREFTTTTYAQWSTTVNLAIDRKRKRLYVSHGEFKNTRSLDYDGKPVDIGPIPRGGLTVDREGNIFVTHVTQVKKLVDVAELKKVKGRINSYRDPQAYYLKFVRHFLTEKERLGPDDLVWIRSSGPVKDGKRLYRFAWNRVEQYSPEGKLMRERYATLVAARDNIAVDSRGFVYAMDTTNRDTHCFSLSKWRRYPYEAHHLIKYAPGGVHGGEGEMWRRLGVSPVLGITCGCGPTGQVNVDEFDRIFVTDGLCHHVKVFDTAGNIMAIIGTYGNEDSAGPDSKYPKPEIALNRNCGVDVQRDWCFIADTNNGRIVKCRLVYGDSKTKLIGN